jgi:integrase-like protein
MTPALDCAMPLPSHGTAGEPRASRSILRISLKSLWGDALTMAIWRRGKPDALLHHSDQGSQYTSEQFQQLMADHGISCSMSRSGNVWDNAAMESFFSSLKTERTARKTYRTRDEAKADRISEPSGVREPGDVSLGCCQPNRVQPKARLRGDSQLLSSATLSACLRHSASRARRATSSRASA